MQQRLWVIPTGGYLLIPQDTLDLWSSYRQQNVASLEAGGIILGRRRNPHIEIITITNPHSGDIRRRNSFDRSAKNHSKIALREWENSEGFTDYLGEWHTHPEHRPYPSTIDITAMSHIASSRVPDIMLSVIVGIENLWIGAFQKSNFTELNLFQ